MIRQGFLPQIAVGQGSWRLLSALGGSLASCPRARARELLGAYASRLPRGGFHEPFLADLLQAHAHPSLGDCERDKLGLELDCWRLCHSWPPVESSKNGAGR